MDKKSIIQWNCRGLKANYNEILILMSLFSPSVICLQETFLKQSDNINFRGFNMFNYICPDGQRASGGTSIMVKSSVPHSRGWSGGAMVLGKLPVPGRPTVWMIVGQGPIALAVGAGGGCLDILTLLYPFSPLSPSLWETARYRLKYCLKGPLNPKQPTNYPTHIVSLT